MLRKTGMQPAQHNTGHEWIGIALQARVVELEFPKVPSLSFEGNCDSGPYLFHVYFCCSLCDVCELIFTALQGIQTRSSNENSVCLSVKRADCDKTEEKSVQIFIPYERSFSLVFWEKEWLMRATLLPEISGQRVPIGAKSPILNQYSLVAPQP